jgi:hypothetical protein
VTPVTTYFTAVSNGLLPDLRTGERMPAGFRLKREVGPIVSPHPAMTLVEFEDDEAPAELTGRTVTPTFKSHYNEQGELTHTTVESRDLDSSDWQVIR